MKEPMAECPICLNLFRDRDFNDHLYAHVVERESRGPIPSHPPGGPGLPINTNGVPDFAPPPPPLLFDEYPPDCGRLQAMQPNQMYWRTLITWIGLPFKTSDLSQTLRQFRGDSILKLSTLTSLVRCIFPQCLNWLGDQTLQNTHWLYLHMRLKPRMGKPLGNFLLILDGWRTQNQTSVMTSVIELSLHANDVAFARSQLKRAIPRGIPLWIYMIAIGNWIVGTSSTGNASSRGLCGITHVRCVEDLFTDLK
jgi:hypothetical protein